MADHLHVVPTDQQELLTLVNEVLSWIPRRGSYADRMQLTTTEMSLKLHWDRFLPHEREHALNLLLKSFCDSQSKAGFNYANISFAHIVEAIGYDDQWLVPTDKEEEAKRRIGEIRELVTNIVRHSQEECAQALWAPWSAGLPGEPTSTESKLVRMSGPMYEQVVHQLQHVLRAFEHGTPVPNNIPSLDTVYFRAHIATTSAGDRFKLFCRFFDDLVTLYDARMSSEWSHGGAADRAEEDDLKHVQALRKWLSWRPEPHPKPVAQSHFEDRVSVNSQVDATQGARRLLEARCREYHNKAPLESLKDPILNIFTLLKNTELLREAKAAYDHLPLRDLASYPTNPPPTHNPFQQYRSLAHESGQRRISSRYAKRYYGTTADEWERTHPDF